MDRIFRHAELTIIAAAGDNSDYGLPGVGCRARDQQPMIDIGHHRVLSTLSEPG